MLIDFYHYWKNDGREGPLPPPLQPEKMRVGDPIDLVKPAVPEKKFNSLKPGDPAAAYQAVYADLKRLARRQLSRESTFTDLPVTALVHESYARMAKLEIPIDRAAFFSYAARAMRSVIVDYVRSRETGKRDGIEVGLTVAGDVAATTLNHVQILAVDKALEELGMIDQRAHDLVELRYFGGFTLEECASQLGVSMATATRDWQKARAFLSATLGEPADRR